jgi:phosphohistidine phosphatase
MNIYFLRHGDASADERYSDEERPLTDLGVQQATLVGRFLKKKKIRIDAVLSSPMIRARETASIVRDKVGIKRMETCELLLNGNNQEDLFRYINGLDVESVLLVGHIPHLENTILR